MLRLIAPAPALVLSAGLGLIPPVAAQSRTGPRPPLSRAAVGLPGFVPDVGFVENPGQALSALIIPLKTFVPGPAK